ncbi:MAG: hypothetical protein ABIU54_06895 [Candidatus Eisenbacteria bacterium]
MSPIFRFAPSLMCVALLATAVSATQVTRMDTRTMAQTSSEIVIGKVTGTQAHWNDARTKIVTDVRVEVSESLKGGGSTLLTLTQLGGEVDGARYNVPGCPAFRAGEEVLLFVWRDTQGRAQVNGLAQGKFEIQRDALTGEATVQRALPGLTVGDAKTLAVRATRGETTPVRLSELKTAIREALSPQGAGR